MLDGYQETGDILISDHIIISGTASNGQPEAVKMKKLISLLIVIVTVIIFIVIIIGALNYANEHPKDYQVEYNSSEGIITIVFDNPIPSADWAASVGCDEDRDGHHSWVIITKNAQVSLSEDCRTATVTDKSGALINLHNNSYQVELYSMSGSETSIQCSFTFNGHEYSTGEWIGIGLAVAFIVGVFALGLIRRLVRGRW